MKVPGFLRPRRTVDRRIIEELTVIADRKGGDTR